MSGSRWVAPALWAILIESLTSWPSPPSFGAPAGSDKLAHIMLYAVFGYLVVRAAQRGKPSPSSMILTLIALTVWAALDEAHQLLIAGRTASVGDWISDTAGVALGIAVRRVRALRPTQRVA
ncbi:MAG: VanZ family protein [Gemmatimonadetes bacterium]|nr:VanZ family protein [Gemmatimonadota bacterium]